MSESRISQSFPNMDEVTEWYLNEIVYCLEHYLDLDREQAFDKLIAWSNLKELMEDDPRLLYTEPAFYWAMGLMKGFDTQWWRDPALWEQYNQYVRERHHPPVRSK